MIIGEVLYEYRYLFGGLAFISIACFIVGTLMAPRPKLHSANTCDCPNWHAVMQEALTLHTAECQECEWKIIGVPFRRYQAELESHSRTTQHLDYFGDAQVILEAVDQASPPPAKHH